MYKSSLLLLLLCLLSPYTWSQDFNNYQLLKAEGPIPEDFLSSSTEKFQASVASIERNTNSRERNIKKRFYLESNFGIDDLLLSGRVLFNDPVSKYLNKVADEILSDDPELRKQLRFYVLKSPVPNAFTTEQGIVFVNLGLLPRLDNEAQLAFILCHEIAHFIEHHVIEGYVASAQIDLSKGEYRKTSDYEKLMLKNLYSQDHEMAADIKGFALFAKTKYAAESIPAVFEVLKNAEYPHISPQDPGTLFHTQTLDLGSFDEYHKERLELEAAASDDELDDTDDEEEPTRRKARRYRAYDNSEDEKKEKVSTTHPSPEKRRDAIIQELIKLQPTGEASFLVSEADFQRITQIANFELCDIFLQTTAYQDALHHILALREQYPRSDYLDFALVRALYGKAKYRLEGERHDEYMSYTDQEGILLHFHKYAKRINTKKLAALALSHSWEYLEAHTSHLHAEKIVEDLIVDLLDKYPGLEDKRSKKDTNLKLFFIELKKQENFTQILEKCIKEYERIEEFEEFQSTAKGRREIHKWEAKNQRKGYSLGVDTVVVFAPLYYRVDATKNKKPPVQYLASEEQQAIFHQYILENAENLNLKMIPA